MHLKNENNLKVVTHTILAFLSCCILALLKAVCCRLKKISLAVKIRLVTGNEATVHLVERDYKFAPDLECVPILCQHNS